MHDMGYAQQALGWFVDTGVCGNVELKAAEGICSLATRFLSPDSVEKAQVLPGNNDIRGHRTFIGCCEKLEDGWAPSAGKPED